MRMLDARARDGVRRNRTPVYVGIFLIGLLANSFAGNADLMGLPIGLDRPLFLISLVMLFLEERRDQLFFRPVFWMMASCVLWTTWSWAGTGSLTDATKAFALTDRIAVPFVMFAVGVLMFSSPQRRDLLLKTMSILGLYLGVTAIGEVSGTSAIVVPGWILDPSVGIQFGRARGPFLYSEAMGMTGALCLFAALLLWWRASGLWRVVATLAIPLGGATVLLSLTRTAWLSSVLALVAMSLLVPRLRKWLPFALGSVVAVIGLVLVSAPGLAQIAEDRLTTQRSLYDRALTNAAAGRIINDHPWQGIGWGRFVEVSGDWVRQADTYPVTNVMIEAHNVFLARAAETGVIGAVLWGLAMLLGPVAAVFASSRWDLTEEEQAWRLLAIGALIIWLLPTLLSPNNYPLPNNLIWLIGGVAGRRHFVKTSSNRIA